MDNNITLKQQNHLDNKPMFAIKDPVSAITHFIGIIFSQIACPILLIIACYRKANLSLTIALAIFALSMILLYSASTAYHSFVLPEKYTKVLKRIDHISIFYLIAGSYTPICVGVIQGKTGTILLIAIWSMAILGTVLKYIWINCPKYVSSIIYISMGWLALFSIKSIYAALPAGGFFWLLAGGIFYTIGGILYSFHIQINESWGNHEIFHLFVLAGSLCHYILMMLYVA